MFTSLLSAGAVALGSFALTVQAANATNGTTYVQYSTVTGYFLQDEPSTNATSFDYTTTNFGLINRTYPADAGCSNAANLTQWQRFARQIYALNEAAPANTVYKLLFMGRHGEGEHNAAQTYYGTPAWNCYWAELDGNGTAVWADAHLTAAGIAQAQVANDFWRHEFAVQKIPAPQSYYTSPLSRCLETANITFSGLDLPMYYPFIPTVKHLFRETISIHTCDRRSNKTYIHDSFPSYIIEPGFTEYDELWNGVTSETNSAQVARSYKILTEVFEADDHTYISITSHSGEIGAILEAIGHQAFSLNTGAVIPALVKAEFLPPADAVSTSTQPWTVSPHCTVPPVTSQTTGASMCVCPNSAAPVTTTLAPYPVTTTTGTSPASYTS